MHIKQFEDKNLSQYSYAILSDCEKKIILIDPSRNPKQYLDYANQNNATIKGVIETHPHADFVSGHLELHNTTGAIIYADKRTHALYPHQSFNEGQEIQLGKITLFALDTPGHSPDSICILLVHDGKQKAIFTGDTLFIGDCGRPDLRPGEGDAHEAATALATQMYYSLRNKLMPLEDDTIVYPAHGAGTLCGKALSKENKSTIGEQKKSNWSLQEQTQEEFIKELLHEQPFVPAYFPFDVALNKKGAPAFEESVNAVKRGPAITNESDTDKLDRTLWIIDVREQEVYKSGHLPHSINLMRGAKFDTWLGSIIHPNERFYITAADEKNLLEMIERTASIGYEAQIEQAFIVKYTQIEDDKIDVREFKEDIDAYTIIDVRDASEVREKKIFDNSINIPLSEVRDSIKLVPLDKPIVVHCASGYRSAAGSSLIQSELKEQVKVFDLGEAIKNFM